MASKTSGGKKKKKKQPASLISKLNLKLLQDRGRHCFNDWFSSEEIDYFRDNADTSMLDPLFERYQVRMEAALEDFASEEGLNDPTEIIVALRECRDERDEWKKLDKMIDTMTKKEEFFVMMQKKAERTHAKKREPPHPDSLRGAGGKSSDAGDAGSKSGGQSNRK